MYFVLQDVITRPHWIASQSKPGFHVSGICAMHRFDRICNPLVRKGGEWEAWPIIHSPASTKACGQAKNPFRLTGGGGFGKLMDHLWRPDDRLSGYPSSPRGRIFRGSSMVEQPAVNRLVVGSNPTRGASRPPDNVRGSFVFAREWSASAIGRRSIEVKHLGEGKRDGGVVRVGIHDVLHVGPPFLDDGRAGEIGGGVIIGEFLHSKEIAGARVEDDGVVGDSRGREAGRKVPARFPSAAAVYIRLRTRA